jgi:hypothetical protein
MLSFALNALVKTRGTGRDLRTHEPYAFPTAQVYLANSLISIKQPVGFYSAQKTIFPESAVRSVHKRAWVSNPHLGSQIKWLPLRSPRWSNKFAHWALGLLDYCYKRI